MLLTTEQKIEFAKTALQTFDIQSFQNLNFENAISDLLNDLNENLDLNDPEFMQMRCERFQIPNTKPLDFAERIIEISDQKKILAGIRFYNLDVSKPFVEVWPNFAISDTPELLAIMKIVKKEFQIFSPLNILVYLSMDTLLAKHQLSPNTWVVAGCHQNLVDKDYPKSVDQLNLIPITHNGYRKFYEELYAQFHLEKPGFQSLVKVNDEQYMQKSINEGLLYYAQVNGELAGIVGGNYSSFLGMKALYMNEIILSDKFRGRGLASDMQHQFLKIVPQNVEVVWGTIHAENLPSLKTALKVGREIVRCEYSISLNGI